MGFRGVAGSASRPALLEQPGECGDVGGGGAAAPADEPRTQLQAPRHPISIVLRFIVREEFPADGFLRLAQVRVEAVGQAVGERNEVGIDFLHPEPPPCGCVSETPW